MRHNPEVWMSLSACPACGGSVSEQAGACPHCGHPLIPLPPPPVVPPVQDAVGHSRPLAGYTIGMVLGAAAIVIGSFLPWATALGGVFSKAGTEGDGVITLGVGVVMAILAFVHHSSGSTGTLVGYGIGAFAVGAVAIYDAVDIGRIGGGVSGIAIGAGLWMVIAGAAVGVIAAYAGRSKQ